MPHAIRVIPTGIGTSDWRVEFSDGKYICDFHVEITSKLRGSYVKTQDGRFVGEGDFDFIAWDVDAAKELLTALVRSMYPEAIVDVTAPVLPRKAAGA